MKVTDLIGSQPKPRKRTQIVACLQRTSNQFSFTCYDSQLDHSDNVEIVRVGKHGEYDVIVIRRSDRDLYFLAYWNDGPYV